MTKPLAYLRDRPLALHALVLAYRTVLARAGRLAEVERKPIRRDPRQLPLKLEAQ